jgi:hypothetical protein
MKVTAPFLLASVAVATDLIIPLYQYPAGDGAAWNPILEAVQNKTNLNATIIINPNNGPGNGVTDPQYLAGARALAANPNVQLLGYVHTQINSSVPRCSRPWDTVASEIRTWSTWVSEANIPIQGIFIDEAPANADNDCISYMRNLTALVQNDTEILFPRRLVVFNPGSPGERGDLQPYYDMNPTLIAALETCFVINILGGGECDECRPGADYEVYDSNGYGSSIDGVLNGTIGMENYNRTAVLVHGVHDTNGMFEISEEVLRNMIRAVVQRAIGAVFFNAAAYTQFTYDPVRIQLVGRLLDEENRAAGVGET